MAWANTHIPDFGKTYNKSFDESVYSEHYIPVETTNTTNTTIEPKIDIEFLNVQDRQIFNTDIELRVRIKSNVGIDEKTLFIGNIYFGELKHINDDIFGIKIPKESLSEESELKVHVVDSQLNILEKAITVVLN
ncbi:MAG: hypothetical protein PHG49_01595 [Candidatus Pacebacteria bacterium]|nr:hypothetical protein [Candidatus Paceibacterota bacterium]